MTNGKVDLRKLQRDIHKMARDKGFWDESDDFKGASIGTKIALIHTEISEALEEFRKPDVELDEIYYSEGGKPEGFGVELADAVIRILDLAEKTGNDMSDLIKLKMKFNKTRPTRHGGKRA